MRIVIAAPVLPYPGVPHAGGELLLRHVRMLSENHDVTLLVPHHSIMPHGEPTWDSLPCPTHMIGSRPARSIWSRLVEIIRLTLLPTTIFTGFWRQVDGHPAARIAVDGADLIELQWFEMAMTAREIRRRGAGTPLFGVYHDVMSQRLEREYRTARGAFRRALRGLRWRLTQHVERRVATSLTMNLCLSDKDADLLLRSGADVERIAVLKPPLDEPNMPVDLADLQTRPPVALLVAAFGRVENDEGARWLLTEVWPRVRAREAGARLVLAGGGMCAGLSDLVEQTPGASATGYLPSLGPCYEQARVALSPVRRGAGVKFKSIIPMLWGIPVVATEVGAEGIERDLFLAIEDDAVSFAAALCRGLSDPAAAAELRQRALSRSREMYGESGYRKSISRIYAI